MDLFQKTGGGISRREGNRNDSPTCAFNLLASNHLIGQPIGTFDKYAGEHARDQFTRCRLIENRDVINGREGGQNFGTVLLRHQRTFGALVAANAPIAVDRDNQQITQGARFRQTSHVPRMQQIEAAIGENYLTPIALFTRGEQNEFVLRNDFSHRWRYDGDPARHGLLRSVPSYYHAAERR